MGKSFSSKLIRRGLHNGMEYIGVVMKSDSGDFIADIHDEPKRSDPIYSTFPTFEQAQEFVLEQWQKKFGLEDETKKKTSVHLQNKHHSDHIQMRQRMELLHSIYREHFEGDQKTIQVDLESMDADVFMRYHYLSDRGFIKIEAMTSGQYEIRIAADGMDIVEQNSPLR